MLSLANPSSNVVSADVIMALRLPKSRIERFSFRVSTPDTPTIPYFAITWPSEDAERKLDGSSLYSCTISAPMLGVSVS